jgi:hypothetical protein
MAATKKKAADVQRKVQALRARIEQMPPGAEVNLAVAAPRSRSGFADSQMPFEIPGSFQDLHARGSFRAPSAIFGNSADNDDEISLLEAARILRMSRPSVVRLIEKGVLQVRTGRSPDRLSRAEVVTYRDKHELVQRQALENLAAMSDEFKF